MSKDKNVKNTKENLKYFEVTLFLRKDNNKSIYFIAPAKTSGHLINVVEDVCKYILEHKHLDIDISELG